MSAGWVAVSVRSRALVRHVVGVELARRVASASSLEAARDLLTTSSYAPVVNRHATLDSMSRELLAEALWRWRVLAGWCPPLGSARVRVLAGPFELANVDGVLARLGGGNVDVPLDLGSLASVRLDPEIASIEELRARLARSPWGDPGTGDPGEIRLALRLTLAARVADAVPEAATWAASFAALTVARCLALGVTPPARTALARLLGARAASSASLDELRTSLARELAQDLERVEGAADLYRAEARWRARVVEEAVDRARRGGPSPETVVCALVALYGDALGVRAALALAAGGGREGGLDAPR